MSERDSMDRKIRTIKFIVLSIVLFLICDVIGQWFLPEGFDKSGIWRIVVWCISFVTGASVYYGLKTIDNPIWKIVAFIIFQTLFVSALVIFHFYSYGDAELIGYKSIITVLPLIAVIVKVSFKKFIIWYGGKIKTLFKLEAIRDIRFFLSMILLLALIIIIFVGGYKMSGCFSDRVKATNQLFSEGSINNNKDHREPVRQYDRIFNDLNDTQLAAAKANGLRTFINAEDAPKNSHLTKIEDCRYYEIEKLTHSIPYLVPKAAKLVEDIGKAFQDSLYNRGYSRNHKITITSVLRSQDHVKSLRKTNVNSTENSCHCYGTTIDISYFRFETPEYGRTASVDKMRQILMQVAYDLRNDKRCYVKYEKQQTCLHITVR